MNETVTYQKRVLSVPPNWASSGRPLVEVDVRNSGEIGGQQGEVEVDFANEDVGFGVYGTQEEILFGTSPELCVMMLFCDTLASNETYLVKGTTRYGEHTGMLKW